MSYILGILGLFLGDGLIKKYMEENKTFDENEDILGGRVSLTKYHNRGAMLNFMEDKPEWILRFSFVGAGIAFLYFLQVMAKGANRLFKIGMMLLMGGGLSNLYDRLKKGYVVDYFIINYGRLKKVIFNLSDIMIFLGGFLTLAGALLEDKKSRKNEGKDV